MTNDRSYRELLTPANIVTTARIVFIPVFVFLLLAPWPDWAPDPLLAQLAKPWIAAAVFTLLAVTDGLDGYLARTRNEVTTLGKFLDPLADKILVTAALLALIELGKLPAWIALIIIARDFLVSGLRMVASAEDQVIAASHVGKVKTVFQIIAVILFIVKDSNVIEQLSRWLALATDLLAWLVMLIALLLTLLSMIDYFWKSSSVLGLPPGGGKGGAGGAGDGKGGVDSVGSGKGGDADSKGGDASDAGDAGGGATDRKD
ncbi:MAG: CDP-diacylglycerol--glycerol-3-phosphate 3-phosphatidyltransferase [Coriobacteriales bacterium]|jgi:CDP-diacylglycerol--glycerol-3-phosphate 3-phosphatidyltransferase|nr:CDP-diacylglycerol--glycerol-3-phosphate 3-phosphatidyltransferase [Coriobacteriales bacterium]